MNKPDIKRLKELAEKATPGPWYHCQPFQRVEKARTIHGTVPAQFVDFVSTRPEPVHQKIVIPMEGRESRIRSEDMALICAAINALPALIAAYEDAERFRARELYRYEKYVEDCDKHGYAACMTYESWEAARDAAMGDKP